LWRIDAPAALRPAKCMPRPCSLVRPGHWLATRAA
jgi:hypothetical protein